MYAPVMSQKTQTIPASWGLTLGRMIVPPPPGPMTFQASSRLGGPPRRARCEFDPIASSPSRAETPPPLLGGVARAEPLGGREQEAMPAPPRDQAAC
jgi:hypothetical protein